MSIAMETTAQRAARLQRAVDEYLAYIEHLEHELAKGAPGS